MSNGVIQNPQNALGGVRGSATAGSVVSLSAATAINAGDLVALSSTSGNAIRCLTNTATGLIVGVALATVTSGSVVQVATSGPVYGVKKDTSSQIAAGDYVTRAVTDTASVTTLAGTTAVTQLKDTGVAIGIAMATSVTAATTVDLLVCKL